MSVGLACQRGEPTATSPVSNASAPGVAATAPPALSMAVPPAPPEAGPPQIALPRSLNTAISRTRRPFTQRQLAWLSRFEFKDFIREDRGTTDEATEIAHTTNTHPRFGVNVRIDSCPTDESVGVAGNPARTRTARRVKVALDDPRACVPMRLPEWQARSNELKQFLHQDLVARSETQFDIGARNVAGATAIYTYQLGHLLALDDRDRVVNVVSDAYILYYNDGVNRIRVIARYLDEPVATRNRLLALAPRSYLEKMAVAFMSVYLHAWHGNRPLD
jgi:hypothetical protein